MTAKSNPPNPPADAPTHKLVVTREFAKPRERVWKAWTDPAQIKQWTELNDEGTTVESAQADLRAGGRFRIQQKMADGEYYTAVGTYLEVKEPERLVYTWDWEKDGAGAEFGEVEGNETQITVEFHTTAKGTQLVLTHEKFDSVERRDRHITGWGMWIDRLEKFLGKKSGNTTV